jgi:hypothetical protein
VTQQLRFNLFWLVRAGWKFELSGLHGCRCGLAHRWPFDVRSSLFLGSSQSEC